MYMVLCITCNYTMEIMIPMCHGSVVRIRREGLIFICHMDNAQEMTVVTPEFL